MQPNQKFTDKQYIELYNREPPLTDKQIAETLNVSTNAIRKRRYRLKLMPKNPQSNSNPTLSHKKLKESDKKQNQKPKRKTEKKAYLKDYNKRPEVKAKMKTREQTPKRKAWKKTYMATYHKKHPNASKKYYHKKHPNAKYYKTKSKIEHF